MAWRRRCIHLVLDFDGTVTSSDTTAIIGGRCLAKAMETAPPGFPMDKLPHGMQYYSELYFQQYKECKEASRSSPEQRTTINEELSWLSESCPVELNSFLRVRLAVLHEGMDSLKNDERLRNEFMMNAGREAVREGEIQIRDPEALSGIIGKASRWGVVSVSWSARFILGALVESGLISEGNIENVAKNVKANELLAPLPADAQGRSKIICSAMDKKEAFEKLLSQWAVEDTDNEATEAQVVTIYVGDSTTDLGCLADASVGLYIGKDGDSLVQCLDRLGIGCKPLSQSQSSQDNAAVNTKEERLASIYIIQGFDKVYEWLFSSC